MPNTLNFNNIDSAKWNRIRELVLNQAGVGMQSNEGKASGKGLTIGWKYDPTAQTLAVTLLHREIFDPSESRIDFDINQIVTSA